MEIGPYRLKDDKTLVYNDGAWNEFANVLFVDSPVGTGFSYVDTNAYVHELDEVADQFVTFMEKWYALFPEYEHDDVGHPVFLAPSRLLTTVSRFTLLESRTLASISPTSQNTSSLGTRIQIPTTSGI
jgi:hypothetical protein